MVMNFRVFIQPKQQRKQSSSGMKLSKWMAAAVANRILAAWTSSVLYFHSFQCKHGNRFVLEMCARAQTKAKTTLELNDRKRLNKRNVCVRACAWAINGTTYRFDRYEHPPSNPFFVEFCCDCFASAHVTIRSCYFEFTETLTDIQKVCKKHTHTATETHRAG